MKSKNINQIQLSQKDFSHVSNFTDYMKIVGELVVSLTRPSKVLDIPAGQGLLGDYLKTKGYHVTFADINGEKANYVYADLDKKLPFPSNEFDITLCMEGLEHVIYTASCISELCRITASGGKIIVTLPNIQNIFSRIKFLCTGYFYQFEPWSNRYLQEGEIKDRGHVSSLSYLQLAYLFQNYGASLISISGDRWKKKWLIPLVLPYIIIGWIWCKLEFYKRKSNNKNYFNRLLNNLFSPKLLFSRSLIMIFEKTSVS